MPFVSNPPRDKERDHTQEAKSTYEGGAQSSQLDRFYELIPMEALDDLADRLTLGAKKYSSDNWKKGGKEFVKARYRHLIRHVHHLKKSANTEGADDDLGASLCNSAFLSWYRRNKPASYRAAMEELEREYKDPEILQDVKDVTE